MLLEVLLLPLLLLLPSLKDPYVDSGPSLGSPAAKYVQIYTTGTVGMLASPSKVEQST